MAALKCSCPRCRRPFEVRQALPARVQCPGCGAAFTVAPPTRAAAGDRTAVTPHPPIRTATPAGPPLMGLPAGAPPVGNGVPVGRPAHPPGSGVRPAPAPVNGAPVPVVTQPRPRSVGLVLLFLGCGLVMAALLVGVLVYALNLGPGANPEAGGPAAAETPAPIDELPPVTTAVPTTGRADPRVAGAVEKGVDYLKRRLLGQDKLYYFGERSDPHVGAAALAGLTLLECGVAPTDPAVRKAAAVVRDGSRSMYFTYSVALSVLLLDRLADHKDVSEAEKRESRTLIQKLALQLIAGQHPTGGWNYNCQMLTGAQQERLLADLKAGRFRPGSFAVPDQFERNYHDNSIAQFAILALWAARKHGVPVTATLTAEERRYREQQRPDGSWSYNERVEGARDATTCAGLIGLAVGWGVRQEDRAAGDRNTVDRKDDITRDPTVRRGLAFVARAVGKPARVSAQQKAARAAHTREVDELNRRLAEDRSADRVQILRRLRELDNAELATGMYFDADAWGDLYFLWCVERVGVIYGLDRLEGKDWYGWGSEVLLKNQESDGSWKERFPGVPDTCFALLFLKRVNIAKDLTDKLRLLAASLTVGRRPAPDAPPARREG